MENSIMKFKKRMKQDVIDQACGLPREIQVKLFNCAFSQFRVPKTDQTSVLEECVAVSGLSKSALMEIIGLYISIIVLYMQMSKNRLPETLLESSFTPSFIKTLPLANLSALNTRSETRLLSFKWRVDISFVVGNASQRILPTVVISMKTNDKKYILEVNLKQFQKLRYSFALLLKEVRCIKDSTVIKKKPVL